MIHVGDEVVYKPVVEHSLIRPKPSAFWGRVIVLAKRGDCLVLSHWWYGQVVVPAYRVRLYKPGARRKRPFPGGARVVYSDKKPGRSPW